MEEMDRQSKSGFSIVTKSTVCLTSGRHERDNISMCWGGVSRSGLIGGISPSKKANRCSELAMICGSMIESRGLNPAAGIVVLSIQVGFPP